MKVFMNTSLFNCIKFMFANEIQCNVWGLYYSLQKIIKPLYSSQLVLLDFLSLFANHVHLLQPKKS